MSSKEDIIGILSKLSVTKIDGQPNDRSLVQLEKELIKIAMTVSTALGGGRLGHAGLIIPDAEYARCTNGEHFIVPSHPGVYPTTNITKNNKAQREAEHKELIKQYEVCAGVEQVLREKILEAVDEAYVLELEDEIMGFMDVSPRALLDHLRNRGGQVDHNDTVTLINERDQPWDISVVPAVHFLKVEKAMKALDRANITSCRNQRRDFLLEQIAKCDEFKPAVREWRQRPVVEQTWDNLKLFVSEEYAKAMKEGCTLTPAEVGIGSANAIEEVVDEMEELVANLTESQSKRDEELRAFMKATTAAITELKADAKKTAATPHNNSKATTSNDAPSTPSAKTRSARRRGKPKKHDAEKEANKQALLDKVKACAHCGYKHPSVRDELCWSLEANASSRPSGWPFKKAE